MRYAVLSDIHSNLEALTAVMDAAGSEQVDRYVCLGDVVGYGAEPGPCLAHLAACEAVIVAGNHDLACVGKLDPNWFHPAAKTAVLWTRDQLSFGDLDVLRRFPLTETVDAFTLVHSSLRHPERFSYLVDVAQAVDTLAVCRTLFCLAGHTHLPWIVEYDRAGRRLLRVLTAAQELIEVTFADDPDRMRYLVNPGSVGQPRDGDPRASYCVYDPDLERIEIKRVAYNIDLAKRKILEAGLPELLALRLAVGQ